MSAPTRSIWADAEVVIQCACTAAAAMTPQKPGDQHRPSVRQKSMTTYSPTVERTFCASSGSILPFQNASDTLALLISMRLVGYFFLRLTNPARNFRLRFCTQARRHAVRVSVCVQSTFCLSVLRLEGKGVAVNCPNLMRDDCSQR